MEMKWLIVKTENNIIEEKMIRKTLQLYRCFYPFTARILWLKIVSFRLPTRSRDAHWIYFLMIHS